jgi:O-antigen/teichoic acid export membrane protein
MTSYTKFAVRGATTIFIISIIAAFLGYIVRVILARNLSVEDFGLFYAVFAFLGLIGIFKSFGFDKALAKFIPEFRSKSQNNFIKSSMLYVVFIQLATNSVIIVAVYMLSNFLAVNYFHDNQAVVLLKILAVAFFVDSFIQTLKTSFQGFKRMLYFSGIDLVRMLLIIGIIFFGFRLGYGILSPVYAYLVTPVILFAVFGAVLVKKIFPEFFQSRFLVDKKLLKRLSKYSLFILATTIGGIVLGYTDIVMLTYFSGLQAVALYSVALPTSRIIIYFPRAIAGVLLPVTSELWAKRKLNLLKEGMESLYKYMFMIVIPLVFMVFSFAGLIISIFFGQDYIPAANAMKILSVGMLFAPITGICINFLSGIGKPQIPSIMVYSAAIFNFIANLILIPMFGIIGAAITTTLSHFIMMSIGLMKIQKFIAVRFPVKIWIKTFAVGLIFVLVIWLLRKALSLNIWIETIIVLVLSAIIYLVLLLLFRVLTISELRALYYRVLK